MFQQKRYFFCLIFGSRLDKYFKVQLVAVALEAN